MSVEFNAMSYKYVTVQCAGQQQQLVNRPENVAAYLLKASGRTLSLRTPDNKLVLSTYGLFIDRCSDMEFLKCIVKKLEPMQKRIVKPPEIELYRSSPQQNRDRNR